jgi:hypothetical protein
VLLIDWLEIKEMNENQKEARRRRKIMTTGFSSKRAFTVPTG